MIDDTELEAIDRDGALLEARQLATRAAFLRAGAVGGAAVVGALAWPRASSAASTNDVAILNYALTLEYLQASFYTETERLAAVGAKAQTAVKLVGAVERAHVRALQAALGGAAVKRPQFDFRGVTESERSFLKTAVAFEDLAVAAYKGQAPLLKSKTLLAAAVSIHSVEARHAAWMRRLYGIVPAANAFDEPLGRPEVLRIVASTHFISAAPRTAGKGTKPRFTG